MPVWFRRRPRYTGSRTPRTASPRRRYQPTPGWCASTARAPRSRPRPRIWPAWQRIWPAIHGLSGLVGVYVLRGGDLSSVVVTLATSVETLDAAQRAVMATELMPGEDPALLPGPDRVEIHRITGRHLPAASTRGH